MVLGDVPVCCHKRLCQWTVVPRKGMLSVERESPKFEGGLEFWRAATAAWDLWLKDVHAIIFVEVSGYDDMLERSPVDSPLLDDGPRGFFVGLCDHWCTSGCIYLSIYVCRHTYIVRRRYIYMIL